MDSQPKGGRAEGAGSRSGRITRIRSGAGDHVPDLWATRVRDSDSCGAGRGAPAGGITSVNSQFQGGVADLTGLVLSEGYQVLRRLEVVSGEADLYICTNGSGEEYVLKVYRRRDAVKLSLLEELVKLRSPHVGRVYAFGRTDDGFPYVVLEYFGEGSLQGRHFSLEELKRLVIPPVLAGLSTLHEAGIIHKDIKPSNLMLTGGGTSVSIIDFGISSLVEDGQTMLVTRTGMSPVYSAPETFNGVYFCESDYYSLGITLYELYTGHTPYEDLSADDMAAYASVQRIPFPDDFPGELRSLVLGLTYKDLSNRNDPANPNRRWTGAEVEKWLQGKSLPVPGEQTSRDLLGVCNFMGRELSTAPEIASAFAVNWNEGKKYVGRGLLAKFFVNVGHEEFANLAMDCEKAGVTDHAFFKLLCDLSWPENFFWLGHVYGDMGELADDLLREETAGSAKFAGDELLWSLQYFWRDDPVRCEALGKIYDRGKESGSSRIPVLELAYFLGGRILLDGQIFSSGQEAESYVRGLREKSPTDHFRFLLRNHQEAEEYRILAGEDSELGAVLTPDLSAPDIDYAALGLEGHSPAVLGKYGIHVVDGSVGRFADLFPGAGRSGRHARVLLFLAPPPENFFLSGDEPGGPEIIPCDRIVLAPHVWSVARMFAGLERLRKAPFIDTSRVDDMFAMFKGCRSLESIPRYDTSQVTNMNQMFEGCSSLEEIPLLDTGHVTNMGMMFSGCSSLISVPELDTSRVTNMVLLFSRCSRLASVPRLRTPAVTDMSYMFSGCGSLIYAPELDTSKVISTRGMFSGCSSVRNIPAMDCSQITNMSSMFKNCVSLTLLPEFSSGAAEDLSEMFENCSSLERGPVMDTSSAVSMASMFNGCRHLQSVPRYRTGKVTDMNGLFLGCSSLRESPSLDTSAVTDMGGMFQDCSSLVHVPFMDTSAVTDMNRMFLGCTSLERVPAMDTSRVQGMDYMFARCTSLKRIPRFSTASLLDGNGMYEGSALPDNIFRYESTFQAMLLGAAFLLIVLAMVLLYLAFWL